MAIRYSTNWMGVANLDWYRKRGLLRKRTITFDENSSLVKYGKYSPGDSIEVEEPIEYYSCGRIDVTGTDDPWGDEIALPPMKNTSWYQFSEWLETFETDDVWTLEQLVGLYERANSRIEWDVYNSSNPSLDSDII